MNVCLRIRVRKQPSFALYFEFETVLKFNNLEARSWYKVLNSLMRDRIAVFIKAQSAQSHRHVEHGQVWSGLVYVMILGFLR